MKLCEFRYRICDHMMTFLFQIFLYFIVYCYFQSLILWKKTPGFYLSWKPVMNTHGSIYNYVGALVSMQSASMQYFLFILTPLYPSIMCHRCLANLNTRNLWNCLVNVHMEHYFISKNKRFCRIIIFSRENTFYTSERPKKDNVMQELGYLVKFQKTYFSSALLLQVIR